MSEPTVTIQMPQALYERLQRLAKLTKRPLASLILQALETNIPPLLEDMPEPIRKDLAALEQLDDEALRHVAQSVWSPELSAQYTELLDKERAATITPSEKARLEELYHEANCHMLRKAYANALLKWCGHPLPSLADLEATQ
jgi:predicted DNA-binding protein